MPKYVIERDIPGIGSIERDTLLQAIKNSSSVTTEMMAEQKNIQWERSYIAGDKTFCVYSSDSVALIQEHAERSGFPATRVTQVREMVDQTSAEYQNPSQN